MERKQFPITVEALHRYCESAMIAGNGKKYVLVSNDEEGNGYHECYFGFSEAEDILTLPGVDYPHDIEIKNCILLG